MTGPLILKDNPTEDLEAATKQYVDNHTSDVVLYTPQTLTDAQKTQARGNINAANGVSAYGKVEQGGWYRIVNGSSYAGGILSLYHSYYSGGPTSLKFLVTMNTGIPEINCIDYPISPFRYETPIENVRLVKGIDEYHLYMDVFYKSVGRNELFINFVNMGQMPASVQKPVFVAENDVLPDGETLIATMEFQNPPMKEGIEYRTTERYMGKPVYVKMVNLGEGTNGKTVNVGTTEMIHVECRAIYSGWSLPMPELPFGSTDKSLEHTNAQAFYSNANTVTIIMGSTCPAFTATAKVYYIKSTD